MPELAVCGSGLLRRDRLPALPALLLGDRGGFGGRALLGVGLAALRRHQLGETLRVRPCRDGHSRTDPGNGAADHRTGTRIEVTKYAHANSKASRETIPLVPPR